MPSMSPGSRLHPPMVWCASIWGNVQYLCQAGVPI